jgi:putative endopeptidase
MKIKSLQISIFSLAFSSFLLSCGGGTEEKASSVSSGLDLPSMDTTVSPAEDFYQYANGNWLKNTKIPSTESRWSNFNVLDEENIEKLKGVLSEAAKAKAEPGSNAQKIGDLYFTAMDSAKLNSEGWNPIKPWMAAIDSMKDSKDIVRITANMHISGIHPLWGIYAMQDFKNSESIAGYVTQGGISLPDCDYYTKTDPESKELRDKFQKHIARIFALGGDDQAKADKKAAVVMNMETELAKVSMNNTQQRDIEIQYNKMTIAELNKKAPNVDWKNYLDRVGAGSLTEVIVTQPKFVAKVSAMMKSVSMDDWKTYYHWKLIDGMAPFLDDKTVSLNFDFFGKTLEGTQELKPRWKRSLELIDGLMGEALGQLYVEKYFTADAKKKVNELVDNLMAVYKDRINALDWMSDSTRMLAQEKLATIIRKLGYPDKWRDYSSLAITRNSLAENVMAATRFEFNRMITKIGQPVDKHEWHMSPPTVNAYYNPSINEIVFPAGIMQPPFFDPNADDAINYARIGAVIGHEISHGFDDQGAKFDAKGNLKDWWTAQDKEKFEAKTKVVIEQFNAYVAIDTMHLNGNLTVGENIADLGGFSIAFEAYQRSLKGKEKKNLDGFTPEQRFFIAGAQMWRSLYTNEALKKQVLTNPHSPGKFRVNGPFSNMPEFYAAFNVKKGDKMYREEAIRAKIW